MNDRRQFVLRLAPLASAVAFPRFVQAQTLPALTETDSTAVSFGFKLDTTKVDEKEYPTHAKEQTCGSCLHYAQASAATARCDIFNKTVPRGGWCIAYAKRA